MLSKSIDLSHAGGFPWTDNRFAFLQTAWTEIVEQLCNVGVNGGAPTVLSGMQSTTVGGTTTVTPGWFVYNGVPVQFTGDATGATATAQTYASPVAAGYAVYVVVTTTSTACPVAFNNGSTPSVINVVTGVLTVLVNTTPVDATHFLLSSIQPWNSAVLGDISALQTEIANITPSVSVSAATGITFNINNEGPQSVVYSGANALSGAVINLDGSGFGAVAGTEYLFMSTITTGDTVNIVPAANVSVNFCVYPNSLIYTATESTYVILKIKYLGKTGGTFYYKCEFLNPVV